MQWFVETTIMIDGKATKAHVDVVPLVGPIAARVPALGAEEAIGRFNASLDGDEATFVYKALFPGGRAEPPEPTGRRMLTVSGWLPDHTRQTIMLIKAVRSWTGLDLLNSKRTVDLLDSRGSFDLDLEHHASGMNEAALLSELNNLGVIHREVRR